MLLDQVEAKLSEASYLAGEEFTMADVMFIPVLTRLELLQLEDEYIRTRPSIAEYWEVVKQRHSYKKVIVKYFSGWRRYKTLFKTWCFVQLKVASCELRSAIVTFRSLTLQVKEYLFNNQSSGLLCFFLVPSLLSTNRRRKETAEKPRCITDTDRQYFQAE
ncbi:hypothetical protein RJ641_029465 [Dillenia turbinata]|uniref:GST C-terminal domain-containing protein n=1 Tax=Dillenia turbinata TaxID=194707 RepID=A0AAN8VYA8_9MAGN